MAHIQPENENESVSIMLRGQEVEMCPDNTTIVQYIMGKVALDDVLRDTDGLDHIHIRGEDDEGDELERWVFRPNDEIYPKAAAYYDHFVRILMMHNFPFTANVSEVSDATLYAFKKKIAQSATENSQELIDELTEFLENSDDEDK